MNEYITREAINRRRDIIKKINGARGDFKYKSDKLEKEFGISINNGNQSILIDHLRLAGDIPESFSHDSSEEKLYSKYTDVLLSETFKSIGLKSIVLTERAGVADVEVFGKEYSFVADTKAFRLSRTAKNQKDFKIQAMDNWKHGKLYAMVVCPIYQLPNRSSQIYQQASTRNVCIFTYSHLSMLATYSHIVGESSAEELLLQVFKVIPALNPSKNSNVYWSAINNTMLDFSKKIDSLWKDEKQAVLESIEVAKKESLLYLANQREKIMRMGHNEALKELIKMSKIEQKITTIKNVESNNILSMW